MLVLFLVIALIQSATRADAAQTLLDQRYANAKIWQLRAIGGVPAMIAAYGPTVVNYSIISHNVLGIGNFGPADVAFEYDFLAPGLEPLIGYAAVKLSPIWDINTTQWITADTLQVDYTITISVGYDPAVAVYAFDNQVFRAREYIVFQANSPLITLGYTINPPSALTMFDLVASTLPAQALCGVIFQACNQVNASGYNYIQDTGFAGFAECVAFMSQVPATQPCPYVQRSNTTACRQLHAFGAFFLPSVHCSHVKPNSPVCRAQCLPACSGCDANAKCVATYPGIPLTRASFNPVYVCQCKNGYIGDGQTCAPILCNNAKKCPAPEGTYSCSAEGNRCECASSFTPQPALLGANRSLCSCPEPSKIYLSRGTPVCVSQGHCLSDAERYMCDIQRHNEVKCVKQANVFDTDSLCVCNYGFVGGVEYPCVCAADRRTVFSTVMSGQVCLNATECTENAHCVSPQVCVGVSVDTVGQCVTPVIAQQKRDLSA